MTVEGKLMLGDSLILLDVRVSLEISGGEWTGSFMAPRGSVTISGDEPYALVLADGRTGQVLIREIVDQGNSPFVLIRFGG